MPDTARHARDGIAIPWLAAAAILLVQTAAQGQSQSKWAPHVDLEAMPGTARSIGRIDVFAPLLQDDASLLFADVRGRFDDLQNREGNFGLGYRRMMQGGWNIGGYGFFDRLRSQSQNLFSQVTLGAELLGRNWDFRANGYIPASTDAKPVPVANAAPVLVGGTIELEGATEHSLGGIDAEAGWRVPLWDAGADRQLRVYAGGYRFAGSGVRDVAGPRGRIEFTLYDAFAILPGARVTAGAEVQHDAPRGTQAFALLRLRIPFGGAAEATHPLDAQARRMTDPVIRDVDVVTGQHTFEEPAHLVGSGSLLQNVQVVSTGAGEAGVQTALSGGGTVILDGTAGPLNVASGLTMVPNQALLGGGAAIPVEGASSGRVAMFRVPGALPTLQASFSSNVTLLTAASGTTIRGVGFSGGELGLVVPAGSTGVIIQGNSFAANRWHGIFVGSPSQPTSVTIDSNSFAIAANEYAIGVVGAQVATVITNNRFAGTYPSGAISLDGVAATVANNVFTGAYAGYNGGVIVGGATQLFGGGNDMTQITYGAPCLGAYGGGSIAYTGPGGVAGTVPASCPPFPYEGGGSGGGGTFTFIVVSAPTLTSP